MFFQFIMPKIDMSVSLNGRAIYLYARYAGFEEIVKFLSEYTTDFERKLPINPPMDCWYFG